MCRTSFLKFSIFEMFSKQEKKRALELFQRQRAPSVLMILQKISISLRYYHNMIMGTACIGPRNDIKSALGCLLFSCNLPSDSKLMKYHPETLNARSIMPNCVTWKVFKCNKNLLF